jgi:hypothetical protein
MDNWQRIEDYNRILNDRVLERLNQGHEPFYHSEVECEKFEIPDGVTDLASECLRGSTIGTLCLPESLRSIGTYYLNGSLDFDVEMMCVLANCKIGKIILPKDLEYIGTFAFGDCHISELTHHGKCYFMSPNTRQFKDSKIDKIKIISDGYHIEEYCYQYLQLSHCSENITII